MSKSWVCLLGVLVCGGVASPAAAQAVYKCGFRSYSQEPCAPKQVVNTDDAPVPVKPNPREIERRRVEQNRALAQSMRQLPGETTAQFKARRHRATLLQEDRDRSGKMPP